MPNKSTEILNKKIAQKVPCKTLNKASDPIIKLTISKI